MSAASWLRWDIVPAEPGNELPGFLVTRAAALENENMPPEVAMLLPSGGGTDALVSLVLAGADSFSDAVIGLFLADPFFNPAVEGRRLAAAGIRWVANLPSVAQQDEAFIRQLADVDLDPGREFRGLVSLGAAGLGIVAVVVDADGAITAADSGAEIVIILPRLADYAAGFPSLRQRESAAQSVARTLEDRGWRGRLLGLAERRDVESRGLWPQGLDGLLLRPVRCDPRVVARGPTQPERP